MKTSVLHCRHARRGSSVPVLFVFLPPLVVSAEKAVGAVVSSVNYVNWEHGTLRNSEWWCCCNIGALQSMLVDADIKKIWKLLCLNLRLIYPNFWMPINNLAAIWLPMIWYSPTLNSTWILMSSWHKLAHLRDKIYMLCITTWYLFVCAIWNDDEQSAHGASNVSSSRVDVMLLDMNFPVLGVMWENEHHSANNFKLPLMILIHRISVNLPTWSSCWKMTLSSVSSVSYWLILFNCVWLLQEQIWLALASYFTHVQGLLNLSIPAKCSVKQMWQYDGHLWHMLCLWNQLGWLEHDTAWFLNSCKSKCQNECFQCCLSGPSIRFHWA